MKKPKAKKKITTEAVVKAPEPVSFFNWPGSIDRVCARICAGGTLVDVCKEFNQHFQAVNGWIEESEERRKRYKDALAIRDIHQREMIRRDLMQLRELDPTMWLNDNGGFKPMHEIPEAARRWILSFKSIDYYEGAGLHRIKVGELIDVKMFDKLKAIDLMTKLLAMVDQAGESTRARTLEDILEGSRQEGSEVHMQTETVTATRTRISIEGRR